MYPRSLLTVIGTVLILAASSSIVVHAAPRTAVPDLTNGGERDGSHDWNLGPAGARGWMWGWNYQSTDSRQILITEVDEGSPADGVLEVGDVILGVGGNKFTSDARKAFGRAITEAENTENKGRLNVIRWRKGKTQNVVVPLQVMGSYSDTSPWDCDKSSRIIDAGCQYLARQMEAGASAGHQFADVTNLLALLASGKVEYLDLVRDHARQIGTRDQRQLNKQMGFYNGSWIWGHTLLFLCEYHLATGDDDVLPAIKTYAVRISEGQGVAGTWDHGMAKPFMNGNGGQLHGRLASGYGAVNAASLICHLSLILARKCGIDHPEVLTAVDKSNRFYGFFIGKGSVPYGDHKPVTTGEFDHNGKTALAAITFDVQGKRAGTRFFSRTALAGHDEREIGHTGNYFSYLWGPLGVNRSGPKAAAAYLKEQRWRYDLSRRADGSFGYEGAVAQKSLNGRHIATYARWDCTGEFLLTYLMPKASLYLTGKGVSTQTALSQEEIAETIDIGRGFDKWVARDSRYDHKPTDELIKNLSQWSPTVRQRAACSLANRQDDVMPTLLAMLKGKDPFARNGACLALEQMGERAAPATPTLKVLLSDDDMWTRVSAARAISAIGNTARDKATVNLLLELAAHQDPANDPWQHEQRWIGYSLFFGQRNNYPLNHAGLLGDSLQGVDRKVLLPTIETLLQNKESMTRAAVSSSVYNNLSYEELESLLPAIYKSTVQPAMTNTMLMERSQIDGLELLSRYQIEEGIDACMRYIDNGRLWNPQKYDNVLDCLRRYGAHAKRVIPELQAVTDHIAEEEEGSRHKSKERQKKIALVQAAIAALEVSENRPKLRQIWTKDNPRPAAYRIPKKNLAKAAVPTVPLNRTYLEKKEQYDAMAKDSPRPDLLFIGDSITYRLSTQGQAAWDHYYGERRAAQIGIEGDRTQWLLWRLQDGNLDGLSPKVIVLMIGTNNLHQKGDRRSSSAQTAEGILAVVDYLRKVRPSSQLVVVGILPRAKHSENENAQKASAIVAAAMRDRNDLGITFIDPQSPFSVDGAQDGRYFKDSVHLNTEGYARWMAVIEPAIAEALADTPIKPKSQ